MTKKILILLVAILAIATVGSATGTLTATCFGCGLGGDPFVMINGTGYQSGGGHNQLTVIVYDSPNPVSCNTYKGGSFTCTTTIIATGWYGVDAYEGSKFIAATEIYIY